MPYILQDTVKENYKVLPTKWENVNIIALEKFWERTDPMAPFLEKQLEAHAKLIRGILTDNTALVDEALKTNLIDLTGWADVITDSKNEEEKQQMFMFKDELLKHPLVAKHLEAAYNLAEQKHFSFTPPNCSAPQTEFTKMPGLFGVQYASVPENKVERFHTPLLINKTKIIGIRTSDGFSNKGLEDFVRSLISGDLYAVKSAVEKHNIDPRFAVLLVSDEMHELRLNPIYEAHTRGYKEIEEYLNGVSEKRHKGQTKQIQEVRRKLDDEHEKWLKTSDEYVRFDLPIEWKYFLELTTKIWGINKIDSEENERGISLRSSYGHDSVIKSSEQIKNEELLIRGILEDNVDMVRSALYSKLIDKSLRISVVTDQRKAQRFDAIQEAMRKNNPVIISLLREYQ